jgi:hypothetical protein
MKKTESKFLLASLKLLTLYLKLLPVTRFKDPTGYREHGPIAEKGILKISLQ